MEHYHLYRVGIWLVARLPLWLVYFVAGTLGEVNFVFSRRSRRGIYANLNHVLPPETSWVRRWRDARLAFRNFAYSIVDFFRIPLMDRSNMDRFVHECRGLEYLQGAMAAGKGGIYVTVHMGSWELGGAYLGMRGIPLTVVALPHKDQRIDQIFVRSRQESSMEVVPVGGALAKLEDALRRGRFTALLADRDVTGKGPVLAFFGEPCHMPDGHAKLALRTGAWLYPARVYRRRNWELCIDIRPPIIPDPAVDTEESLTLRCISYLEEFIRSNPQQWFSFYDLWHATELPIAGEQRQRPPARRRLFVRDAGRPADATGKTDDPAGKTADPADER
jgi:lauroyl/myristoyl acyltransferase